jgi:hypothetical protein
MNTLLKLHCPKPIHVIQLEKMKALPQRGAGLDQVTETPSQELRGFLNNAHVAWFMATFYVAGEG